MGNKLELTGMRFGELTVTALCEMRKGSSFWECICDCGNIYIAKGASLTTKHTTSCMQCSQKRAGKSRAKHGMLYSPAYHSWHGMLQRCGNPNASFYAYYGGRGITVCEEWKTFVGFYRDMGDRPQGTTLDRIDSNGNYCKGNCKWSTKKEQGNNRGNNHYLTFEGKTQTLKQWADEKGIEFETLRGRIDVNGWTIEKALTTPVRVRRKHGQ